MIIIYVIVEYFILVLIVKQGSPTNSNYQYDNTHITGGVHYKHLFSFKNLQQTLQKRLLIQNQNVIKKQKVIQYDLIIFMLFLVLHNS